MAKRSAGLLNRLFRPKHDYLPGTSIFREIDVDLIAGEMKLDEKGARDGAANIPTASSTRPTTVETEIQRRVRSYWDEASGGARRAHEALSSRWTSLTSAADIDTLIAAPKAIASAMNETARTELDTLSRLFDRVIEARAALVQFRKEEGIDRPLRESKTLAVRVFILIFAFALELIVNVSVFAGGDEFGFAGALTKVLAIPALNIGVTFFLVFALGRHIVRRPVGAKIIGAIGIIAALVWAFALNLAVAHWRDSLDAAMSLDAGRIALERIATATFELNNANSWMLFAVGCLAAGLAAYDAALWNDPHPRYTRYARAQSKAEEEFQWRRQNAIDEITAVADAETERLRDALISAETSSARRPELVSRADALAEDLKLYGEHLRNVADDLTTRYREANQRERTTPSPARFDSSAQLKLPSITLPRIGNEEPSRAVDGLLSQAMLEIAEAKNAACKQLPTLTEWVEAKTVQ